MLPRLSLLVAALSGAVLVSAQTQNQNPWPIVGVKVASGAAVPYRKNINDFQAAGGPEWELYIRSLLDIYNENAADTLSYFSIAGIHGKPYVEWNKAGARTTSTNNWQGYCPHGEDLFLPWHRPYLVLFEQRLNMVATRLANAYPAKYRATYQAAAKNLRAPYWDWAASQTVPQATVPSKIKIKVPSGSNLPTVEVDNPLATFKFPKAALDGTFGSFNKKAQIVRCPSPDSYPNSANADMARSSYKQWVYDAFTKSTTFKQFASTASTGISLEQIHNGIHWDGACGGQFLDADYSAFDPLFMLHHANVDRLWTYWQFIRPTESLFTGSYKGQSRWQSPEGTTITANSPLHPFFASAGKFHTPNSVKSIKGFGYTYEGLEYWRKSDSQLKTDATALINKLYGPSSLKSKREGIVDGVVDLVTDTTRYFVQAKVDVEELDRPCQLEFYVNDEKVGRMVVMKQPQKGIVNGEFPMDKAANIVEAVTDTVTGVVNTITNNLRVEITKPDGTSIPVASVPSLQLQLTNVTVVVPDTITALPEYIDAKTRPAPKKQQPPSRL